MNSLLQLHCWKVAFSPHRLLAVLKRRNRSVMMAIYNRFGGKSNLTKTQIRLGSEFTAH